MKCGSGPADEYALPAAWGAFPPCPMRRFQNGVVYTSMRDWFDHGPEMVAGGAAGVHIKDRAPCVMDVEADTGFEPEYVVARLGREPGGLVKAYGWRWGNRWINEPALTNDVATYIPDDVFPPLVACDYPLVTEAILRRCENLIPRWRDPVAAIYALDRAAWTWAVKRERFLRDRRPPQ